MKTSRVRAFTLIELLIVVTVIAILLALTVPAMDSFGGRNLQNSADSITAALDQARIAALAQGIETEVRFYRVGEDAAAPGSNPPIRAFQSYWREGSVSVAKGNFTTLKGNIIVNESDEFSPFAAEDRFVDGDPTGENSTAANLSYFPVRFRADGSVAVPPSNKWWGLTVQADRSGEQRKSLPANYITIQVDPTAGSLRTFQPK